MSPSHVRKTGKRRTFFCTRPARTSSCRPRRPESHVQSLRKPMSQPLRAFCSCLGNAPTDGTPRVHGPHPPHRLWVRHGPWPDTQALLPSHSPHFENPADAKTYSAVPPVTSARNTESGPSLLRQHRGRLRIESGGVPGKLPENGT